MFILLEVPESIAPDILEELKEYVRYSQGMIVKKEEESLKTRLQRAKASKHMAAQDKAEEVTVKL